MEIDNTLRILIATDNHVGYLEKDGIRGNDSVNTFEEILHISKEQKVDFVLLSGDLFHENRPSMRCLNEILRLVRKYCLNDRPASFELLSDPKKTFCNVSFPAVNYMDPNFNIGIPIFTIHGNHDDPSGLGNVCAPDLLHTCGFLNLFGKSNSVETLEISPVLLRKGTTKLAIYGMGAMREERMHRLFRDKKVTFLRPEVDLEDWFSLAAVHQNRVRHGPTDYLPENFLPNFLDLVIWGHEHDCRIEPEWNATQSFYVVQPGSSVATSLIEGEALPKSVGLLEIKGREFKVTRLPLRTVRPFIFDDIVIADELEGIDPNSLEANQRVEQLCANRITAAVSEAAAATAKAIKQRQMKKECDAESIFLPPVEPIIRLRVDVSGGFESFSVLRFGQKFVGRVANPKDLILFNRKRDQAAAAAINRSNTTATLSSGSAVNSSQQQKGSGISVADVETLVCQLLSTNDALKLSMFTGGELSEGLRQFVAQTNNDGIKTTVEAVIVKTQGHLRVQKCVEDRVDLEISRFLDNRKRKASLNGDDEAKIQSSQLSVDIELIDTIKDEESTEPTSAVDEKQVQRQSDAPSKRVGGKRGQTTLNFVDSVFSDDDETEEDFANTIVESDEEAISSFKKSSRRTNESSGVFLMDSQSSSLSRVSVRSTRGTRGAPRTRRATGRRRGGGATSRSLMPDEEEPGNLSFDFRRNRGRSAF